MEKSHLWLTQFLGSREVDCDKVRAAFVNAGFKKAELKRARADLGVKTRTGFVKQTRKWFWYLPLA